jgi:hypothetical protein
MKYNKYKPYIRLANGKERSESFRTALRLAFFEINFSQYYVMVQHGFPKDIMAVGRTKDEIKRSIFILENGKRFNAWANRIKTMAKSRKINDF